MAYDDITLADQPDGGHDERRPIGVRHEAPHQIKRKPEEWSRFFAYKLAIYRSWTDGFPVKNVDISGDVVARRQRPELLADEFTEGAFRRHRLRFPRVGERILGVRVNGVAQYFAVEPVLGLEVVVYCGLINASLSRKGSDTGRFITAFGKQPYRRLQYSIARNLGWPLHFRPQLRFQTIV